MNPIQILSLAALGAVTSQIFPLTALGAADAEEIERARKFTDGLRSPIADIGATGTVGEQHRIGGGGQGSVFRTTIQGQNGQPYQVAMKAPHKKDRRSLQAILREARFKEIFEQKMQDFKPGDFCSDFQGLANIVRPQQFTYTGNGMEIECTIQPLLRGSDGAKTFGRQSRIDRPDRQLELFSQLCHIIYALHNLGYCHNDLKTENIFVHMREEITALGNGTFVLGSDTYCGPAFKKIKSPGSGTEDVEEIILIDRDQNKAIEIKDGQIVGIKDGQDIDSNRFVPRGEDPRQMMLIDLGLTSRIGEEVWTGSGNNAYYVRASGNLESFNASIEADIYSFATMIPEIIFGKTANSLPLKFDVGETQRQIETTLTDFFVGHMISPFMMGPSLFEQIREKEGSEAAIGALRELLELINNNTDGPTGKKPYTAQQITKITDLMKIMLGLKSVPEIPGIGVLPLSEYVLRESQELFMEAQRLRDESQR